MKVRQDPRWPNAHKTLKRLFEERVDMSQAEFGEKFGLGTQGMVWQYLNGYTPLNIEAAAKFAKGLQCNIADISPEMLLSLQQDILPVLGPKALKAALKTFVLALVAIPPLLMPQRTDAIQHNVFSAPISSAKSMTEYTLTRIFSFAAKLFRSLTFAFPLTDAAIT